MINKAIRLALAEAARKYRERRLIPASLWDNDKHCNDFETIYSIISLYSDDEDNDGTWHMKIFRALAEIYPTHI